jgi:hypothetical protein
MATAPALSGWCSLWAGWAIGGGGGYGYCLAFLTIGLALWAAGTSGNARSPNGLRSSAISGVVRKRGASAPHDREIVRGDPIYAPPELLYGRVDPDWSVRCQVCDWYLLGSLIVFIFTRTQTTAEQMRRIPDAAAWGIFARCAAPTLRRAETRSSDVAARILTTCRESSHASTC